MIVLGQLIAKVKSVFVDRSADWPGSARFASGRNGSRRGSDTKLRCTGLNLPVVSELVSLRRLLVAHKLRFTATLSTTQEPIQ